MSGSNWGEARGDCALESEDGGDGGIADERRALGGSAETQRRE